MKNPWNNHLYFEIDILSKSKLLAVGRCFILIIVTTLFFLRNFLQMELKFFVKLSCLAHVHVLEALSQNLLTKFTHWPLGVIKINSQMLNIFSLIPNFKYSLSRISKFLKIQLQKFHPKNFISMIKILCSLI